MLAGPGGNGGGGLVAARHLHNRGVTVSVTLAATDRMAPVPARQLAILDAVGVPVVDDPIPADLLVDALVGYSLTGDPRGRAAELIHWANESPAPVLALDGPSGLDLTTGRTGDPCVLADATLTLALPKLGLRRARQAVAALYAADVSVPPDIYQRMGIAIQAPFAAGPVVRIG